ncbi:MAG: dTDP-4-dehydrorhamnose reductase [Oscillospiraceae bacterium]|jgi:dTDP-4-dehydrorhamnose reductase|nr:dTDP-4-dehydrorhamnose reductase [Oscillospiraceae bacterium]
MKILVTGARGQLGTDVCLAAKKRGHEVHEADLPDFDLTNETAVREAILSYQPDIVLHCAAYTAVDKAETEPDTAFAVNVLGTRYVAEACSTLGIWCIYISTDYVFDGSGNTPWEVTDPTAPLSVYGKTKCAGEAEVRTALPDKYMVVRTSWVFGAHGANFVKTMRRLGASRPQLRVVDDQIGAPSYTVDLASLLLEMAARPVCGTYHASNAGETSFCSYAREILAVSGIDCPVEGIPTSAYPLPAARPLNSRLSPRSLIENGYTPLPDWKDALRRMVGELNSSAL